MSIEQDQNKSGQTGRRVYVLSPPHITTGGPEFCQQICYELNKYPSIDAKIFYLSTDPDAAPPLYIERYNNPYVIDYIPEPDSVLFFPEVTANYLHLPNLISCTKFLVWMSVNYYLRDIPANLLNYFPPKTYHLYQGAYSKDYLLSFAKQPQENLLSLVDYISDEFLLEGQRHNHTTEKENIITFQLDKATIELKKVLEELKDRKEIKDRKVKLQPIKNMTTEQIVNVLKQSKVFIHLGWNPGIDRMPREAGVLDNIIILSTLGAGGYYADHPFPDEYKFNLSEEEVIKKIADKVEESIINYDSEIKKFKPYKNIILGQKAKFQEDIKKIVEFIEKTG